MSAKKIFTQVMGKSENVITPEILRYEKIKNGVIELSKGENQDGEIFTVEVVKKGIYRPDLSKIVSTENKANNYINALK